MRNVLSTLVTFILICCFITGCSSNTKVEDKTQQSNSPPLSDEEKKTNVTLIISDQCSLKGYTNIKVKIDKKTVVDQAFDVGFQHTWISFYYNLDEGKHVIEAESDDGATIVKEFSVDKENRRWILIQHRNEQGKSPLLEYGIQSEPFLLF